MSLTFLVGLLKFSQLMLDFNIEGIIMFAVTLSLVFLTSLWQVEAILSPNPTVACADDTVTFTCTLPGSFIRWSITLPQRVRYIFTVSTSNTDSTQGTPAFRGVLTDSSGGMVTATLTSLSEASTVEGTMVECEGESSQEGPLTITVAADPPSPPLNTIISSTQNQPSSSIITLDWDPPSSTSGVPVSYVLTISPTPLSGSPVTVETTSAQIIVSYNSPYNVTSKAVICAGSIASSDVMVMIHSIVTCLSNPPPANRVTINGAPPLPALVGSTLSFTCNRETVTAACESEGRWSPDPTTYVCFSAAPYRGSVDINGGTPPFSLSSWVTYRCDERLFPFDVRTSTH
ncbi:uncharacterized protein LOC135344610 isoform X2 [Halichondria panicea]|uniref:uncharacterized protein LOC135344610 isoform X2 n=1 Tax=Halichondria panicea TaxID=6063 RepID=UPI00312B4852